MGKIRDDGLAAAPSSAEPASTAGFHEPEEAALAPAQIARCFGQTPIAARAQRVARARLRP
jgi:hypothetical protein